MVRAAIVSCGAKPQGRRHGFRWPASTAFSKRGGDQEHEEDGGGEHDDGDGDGELGDSVEMKVEDIRLEQQISHGAVEVLHTSILCTDLDHFFCRSGSRSRSRSLVLDPSTVPSVPHGDGDGDGDGDDVYACRMIPGFSAAGTITELGSGVLTHHIGQRVAYCTFPIAIDSEPPSPSPSTTSPSTTSAAATATTPSTSPSTTSAAATATSTSTSTPSTTSAATATSTSTSPSTTSAATATTTSTSASTTSAAAATATTSTSTPSPTSSSATSTLPPTSSSAPSSSSTSAWHYKHCCSVAPSLWAPVGAYSDARIVPVDRLIPLPDDVDDHTVAAILFPGLIARALVHEGTKRWRSAVQKQQASAAGHQYTIEPSRSSTSTAKTADVAATDSHNHHNNMIPKVLVYPAMGVLGSLVCQLAAHHDQGALVIGVVPVAKATSTASASSFLMPVLSKHECSRQITFAPDHITKFSSQIQSVFGGHASIVYDLSGEITPLQSCLDCLARGGVYVSLERLLQSLRKIESRHDGRFIHEEEELPGERSWIKMHLFNYVRNGKDLIHSASELIELCRQKQLKCPIVNEYPLESVLQAHKDVQSQAQSVGGFGVCLLKPSVVDPQTIPDLS